MFTSLIEWNDYSDCIVCVWGAKGRVSSINHPSVKIGVAYVLVL